MPAAHPLEAAAHLPRSGIPIPFTGARSADTARLRIAEQVRDPVPTWRFAWLTTAPPWPTSTRSWPHQRFVALTQLQADALITPDERLAGEHLVTVARLEALS